MSTIIFITLCIAVKTISCITCNFGTVSNGTHCEECGLTDISANLKIVGGVEAIPYSWPSQVLIIDKQASGGIPNYFLAFVCGGTLINRYTILTAAHCVAYRYHPSLRIYLGMHNISNLELNPKPPAAAFEISKVIVHPNYDGDFSYQNDIALIILKTPANYTKFIKPECLPKAKDLTYPLPNSDVFVAGWGYTEEGGEQPSLLQNIKLKAYNISSCGSVISEIPKNTSSQICAGNLAGGQDACTNDSGGGLHVLDKSLNKTIRVVAGVVSYGDGCARKKKPGVYTRTSFFLDWIYANWAVDATSLTTTPTTTSTKASTTTTKAPTTTSTKASTTTSKSSNTTLPNNFTTTKTTTKIQTVSILSTIKTNATLSLSSTTLKNNSTLTISNNLLTTSRQFNIQSLIEFLSVLQNILAYLKNYF